jgi:hypothetical protein
MRHTRKTLLAAAAVAAALAAPAKAQVPVKPADIVNTGTMAAACASLQGDGSGLAITGAIDIGLLGVATQCAGQADPASASSGAAWSNAQADATASASATLGTLHLASRLDTEGGTASLYPRAVSQAGYGDLLTVNLANPPAADGFLLVGVRVSGVLDASGNAGFATFQLAVTNDNATLAAGNPGYNKGTGGGISTDRQLPTWIASSFPAPGPLSEHRVIDEMVIFSIPVTFGTSFEMVVLGLSNTATRNSSGGAHSESDFGQTVTWAGVQGLLVGGVPVQGYTLTSGSGIDWTLAAAVPEPAAWWLFAAGLPLLVRLRRA